MISYSVLHSHSEIRKLLLHFGQKSGKYRIFDLFRRKPWTVTENLMTVASEINIPTQKYPEGPDRDSPAYKYVREAYQKLIDKGYLEEYTRTWIREELLCARATPEGISKNIFYGTQL